MHSAPPLSTHTNETEEASASASTSTAEILALKEWNVTCAALGDGKQTVLLRKGGIAEGPFKTRAKHFLMFPTKFHTEESLLQPEAAAQYAGIMDFAPGETLDFAVVGEVTGSWSTFDPTVLQRTSKLHVWNDKFLETRLKWRPKTPITVLEIRAWKVTPQVSIPSKKDYFGCFSWVELQDAMPHFSFAPGAHLQPVMSDAQWRESQATLREALKGIEDLQELKLD